MLSNKNKNGTSSQKELLALSQPDSDLFEQYRAIRTSIHFLKDVGDQVFLITSPGDQEGTSGTAANLAVSIARQNERVLLIDANLRHSSLHTLFNLDNKKGMSEVLRKNVSLADVIQKTMVENLHIVTSGASAGNPVELLGSEHMQAFMADVRKAYDVILVDTPSPVKVADAKMIAQHSDGAILVISNGATTRESIVETKQILEMADTTIVGAIISQ
ncbi:CobQ/CobB/MinD/ParA nucleotide binding protein [Fictibacillus macauensis ZFHKF-1]|uniref:non-specific protein-tyrosine kinase n=1 Tax=Fictibacillus macauensis ZFHKF-1 TaxID=1196324 RepID=I8AL04_9BACL|nr:CpsD/CapB family tyrosine-protein kinase [Fictibacillus macauensis]EIT86527.1 CobQ/CobB/MinD/ParA nucleotide binding protein [Fictibacillus macauensis ZFHKF-1]